MRTFKTEVKGKGCFETIEYSNSEDYPGLDIEFIPENEDEIYGTNPRVLFECTPEGKLRLLIWDDKNNEDYTKEIVFDV